MRTAINALRPSMVRIRTELQDRELWCLCLIAVLLVLAN